MTEGRRAIAWCACVSQWSLVVCGYWGVPAPASGWEARLDERDALHALGYLVWPFVFGHLLLFSVFLDGRVRGNRIPFALVLCALFSARSSVVLLANVGDFFRLLAIVVSDVG